jgi:hypothetical protein
VRRTDQLQTDRRRAAVDANEHYCTEPSVTPAITCRWKIT